MKKRLKIIVVVVSMLLGICFLILWAQSSIKGELYMIGYVTPGNYETRLYSFAGRFILDCGPLYKSFYPPSRPVYRLFARISLKEFNLRWHERFFPLPRFGVMDDKVTGSKDFSFQLPHWLLVILFATPPVLWLHARYKEHRDKKLFEEAVAAKRAEFQKSASRVNETQSSHQSPNTEH